MARATLLVVLHTAAVACGGESSNSGSTGSRAPRDPSPAEAEEEDQDFDTLSKLGYLDYAEEAETAESGVTWNDRERALGGYTLVASIPNARADLVDADGRIVRSWSDPQARWWSRAELGPGGRLAVIGKDPVVREPGAHAATNLLGSSTDYETSFVAVYDWEGERLWRHDMTAHHDLDWLEDGRLLVLAAEAIEVRPGVHIADELLVWFDAEGREERRIGLYAPLADPEHGDDRLPRRIARLAPREESYDILHVNSVHQFPAQRLARLAGTAHVFSADCVLLSVRHLNEIVVLNVRKEQIVWRFGPGELQLQHEATYLDSGRILVFDNGRQERGYSRVVEIDPILNAVTWEWRAPAEDYPFSKFYSKGRGTAQGLAGGSVLVSNSAWGEVLEVDRGGEVVWRYLNPHHMENRRGSVRAERYEQSFVEGLEASVR